MTDDRDITIGEVVRLLQRQDEQLKKQDEQLALILTEARKTNGNVIRHELRLDGLDREVRDLKRLPVASAAAAAASDEAKRDGIVITVPTNGKTIAALLLALVSLLAAWKAGGL